MKHGVSSQQEIDLIVREADDPHRGILLAQVEGRQSSNSLGGLPRVADHDGKLIHGRYHVTSRW